VLDCDFGDLGVTTMLTSPARVTVSGATDRQDCGELDNTAIADADNDDEVEASASITVRCPTLVIDKAANAEVITKTLDAQGNVIDIDPEVVTWTLTYTLTNGPVTNAVITDPIPAGLTYVNGSASNGGVYNAGTRTLTWTFPTLSAGGSVTFQTTVNQDAPVGVILNVATIDSNETESDKGEDSIRIVEEQELGGTSTPQPSLPSTAMSLPSNAGGLAAILFGAILIAALGGLAYVNVTAVRRRR
jgi:fimbrial isopeptide formation D2 family protein